MTHVDVVNRLSIQTQTKPRASIGQQNIGAVISSWSDKKKKLGEDILEA